MSPPHDCFDCVTLPSASSKFDIHIPRINTAIITPVKLWRRVVTLFAIVLVTTDIPRTGLILSPRNYYDEVGLETVMYWGPYEYHIGHVKLDENNTGRNNVTGSCDGKPVKTFPLWPYKYDTLSIAPRAVARYLNVTSYPPCVVYREPCEHQILDPLTVFNILEGLITSVHLKLNSHRSDRSTHFFIYTRSNWIDRLHHTLFRPVVSNNDGRIHMIYHTFPAASNRTRIDPRTICMHARNHATGATLFATDWTPLICTTPLKWSCDHPIIPSGKRTIPIWDHIWIRFDDLQRRYPDTELDFTMFVTSLVQQTHPTTSLLIPTVSFVTETVEVTTLIRGRRCDAARSCQTVFIDDYRYERSSIESNDDLWNPIIIFLRGGSQAYMWLRIILLVWGCYQGCNRQIKTQMVSLSTRLYRACSTFLMIPGSVIVYGSWPPIVGYSLAHFLDSSLVQTVGEYAWATIGGRYTFHPIRYAITASIQMRNIWMIALLWKITYNVLRAVPRGRKQQHNEEEDGFLTFRCQWVGLISWLTTFGLLRALHFRDTNVLSVVELSPRLPLTTMIKLDVRRNLSDYGARFDLKCAFIALVLAGTVAWIVSNAIRILTGRGSSFFACRTYFVPLSARRIWPSLAYDGYWFFDILQLRGEARVHTHPVGPHELLLSSSKRACHLCRRPLSSLHWRATLGCPTHESMRDIASRSKEIWAIVRLTNIAYMTDPLVFLRLYVVGMPLYIHRVRRRGHEPFLVLLPIKNASEIHVNASEEPSPALEYVAKVDSRDVPWHVLVYCG